MHSSVQQHMSVQNDEQSVTVTLKHLGMNTDEVRVNISHMLNAGMMNVMKTDRLWLDTPDLETLSSSAEGSVATATFSMNPDPVHCKCGFYFIFHAV